MAENLSIQSPDFPKIKKGDNVAIHDAIKLLWLVANDEAAARRRQRFRWFDVDYNTVTFSASVGTWTVGAGDFIAYRYAILGDLLVLYFNFQTTSTSAGMGVDLYFTLPNGYKAAVGATGFVVATGTINESAYSVVRSSPNNSFVQLNRISGAAWPSTVTDNLGVRGSLIVQVTA